MKVNILLLHLIVVGNLFAQLTEQKLQASDGFNGNWFGFSVAVTDSFVFVGAPRDNENGYRSGAVYVYQLIGSSWIEVQKITASDSQPDYEFGTSLSVYSNFLVVGSPRANGFSGRVYVYELENQIWNEMQILSSPGFLSGSSVSISGLYILVGSIELASIYKLENQQWAFKQSLVNSDQSGSPVSIYGDNALIGAHYAGNGSVYFYKRNDEEWIETQKIIASDNKARHFGYSLSLEENRAIIGAPWDTTNITLSGSAFIYVLNNGLLVEEQKILTTDLELDDQFGNSVSILGNHSVVGAHHVDINFYDVGAAYIFRNENNYWSATQKLIPSDLIQYMKFGTSVSLGKKNILIGAPCSYYADPDTIGIAYIYSGIMVEIDEENYILLDNYKLLQNYPNPFNPTTTITYQIPELSFVTLKVYDVLGSQIVTLINEEKSIGSYEVEFNASSLPSGVYFYQLKAGSFVETKKMILMK